MPPQNVGCYKSFFPDQTLPHTPAAGIATCRLRGDVKALQAALELPQEQMSTPHAGLFPEFEHLEVGRHHRPSATPMRHIPSAMHMCWRSVHGASRRRSMLSARCCMAPFRRLTY